MEKQGSPSADLHLCIKLRMLNGEMVKAREIQGLILAQPLFYLMDCVLIFISQPHLLHKVVISRGVTIYIPL